MKHVFRKHFWLAGSLLLADGLFFSLTSPTKLPSIVLILGFLLLALSLYHLFRAIITGVSWYGLPIKRHRKRLAGLLTAVLAGLLALQSIGELTLRDMLVLSPLVVLLYFYLSYGRQPVTTTK